MQRDEFGPILHHTQKINSKWTKDSNFKPETVKLLEENIGKNLLLIGLGNEFLDMKRKAQATNKQKQVKLHQTKKLLHSKRNDQQN